MLGSNQRPPPCRDGTAWVMDANEGQGKSSDAGQSSAGLLGVHRPVAAVCHRAGRTGDAAHNFRHTTIEGTATAELEVASCRCPANVEPVDGCKVATWDGSDRAVRVPVNGARGGCADGREGVPAQAEARSAPYAVMHGAIVAPLRAAADRPACGRAARDRPASASSSPM